MEMASFRCANCKDSGAKGHKVADRGCPVFNAEKEKIWEHIPENKYKFFLTMAPESWKLLNEPEPAIGNEQMQHQQQNPGWDAYYGGDKQGTGFMEEWQAGCQTGRPHPPHKQSQSRYRNH
jgi:hypothetical protein